MPPVAEVRRYLQGAWLLAQGDAAGMGYFDCTVDGFWRSFWAAAYVAPAYALVVADQNARSGRNIGFLPLLLVETLVYVVGWAAMPVLALLLTRFFGLQRGYVPLVVALNWSSLVQIAIVLSPVLLGVVLSPLAAGLLMLAASLAVLVYKGFVVKTALDTAPGTAAGFVVAELVVTLLLTATLYALLLT